MFKPLSPKARRNFNRIIPFGLIWTFTGWIFLFVEHAAMGFENLSPESAITVSMPVLIFASIATMIVGCLVGYLEFVVLGNRFKRYSLGKKVIYKLLLYLLFVLVVLLTTFPLAGAVETGTHPFAPEVLQRMQNFFLSMTFVSTFVQIAFSILLCLLYAAVSENLGHQVLLNFFTGRYHTPKVEHRIFMFLDMKSSTSIAEKLGHVKWFEMLDAYYDAMSDPIVNHLGEAYQYIGDEIVVTWKTEHGVADENCVRCFYAIGESIRSRAQDFLKRFGVCPDFRAGIHLGEVTTGEVGALKKEIIYTGDVLNTTARIQALCKEYGRDILISEDLAREIPLHKGYVYTKLGDVTLRGKSETKAVCGVERRVPATAS